MKIPSASQWDRVWECPLSALLPQEDYSTELATEGTWRHKWVELRGNGMSEKEAIAQIPFKYREMVLGLDLAGLPMAPEGYGREVCYAVDTDNWTARIVGKGLTRKQMAEMKRHNELTAVLDVVGIDEVNRRGYVADYKSEWSQTGTDSKQLMTQAMLVAMAHGLDEVRAEIIYLGKKSWYTGIDLDNMAIDGFRSELRDRVNQLKESASQDLRPEAIHKPRPGDHCRYCPAFNHCPSQLTMIRQMVKGDALPARVTPQNVGQVWEAVVKLKSALRRAEDDVRTYIKHTGSAMMPDGSELRVVIGEGNEVVSGRIAREVLTEMISPSAAADAVEMKVTKSAIETAIKNNAPKGSWAEKSREIYKEIKERGGVSRPTVERLAVIKDGNK